MTNSDKHAIGPDTDSGGGNAGCMPVQRAATLLHGRMHGCHRGPVHMPRRTLIIEVSSAAGRIMTRGRCTEFMLKAVIP